MDELGKSKDLFPYIFTFIVIFCIGLLCYLVYSCISSYYKKGGACFLNNEEAFDEEYFEIRRQTNYSKTWLTNFPLSHLYIVNAQNSRYMYPFRATKRYRELSLYNVHVTNQVSSTMFLPLINALFNDMKNLNHPLRKKLFQERKYNIDFWNGNVMFDINKITQNIVDNIPSKNLLTENEIKQIDRLFYEIAINGIIKNPAKFEKFKKYLSKIGYRSPEDAICRSYIDVYDIEHLKWIFEGLSSELDINFNLYDVSYQGIENDIPKIRIESSFKNSSEINLLYLFPLIKHSKNSYNASIDNVQSYPNNYLNNPHQKRRYPYNSYPQSHGPNNLYNSNNGKNDPRYSESLKYTFSESNPYNSEYQVKTTYSINYNANPNQFDNNSDMYYYSRDKVKMFLLTSN